MTSIAEKTLASIVSANHQAAPVLEKYNLDFCCKGKRTLAKACLEKGLSVESVATELEAAVKTESVPGNNFTDMTAAQLINHILIKHHFYVKQVMPAIEEHLTKVVLKHGEHFPNMKEVLELFTHLKSEMSLHLQKEEVILFPRIKELETAVHNNQHKAVDKNYIAAPAGVMENEHDEAGEIMYHIRKLTGNYTAPADACTTFRLVLDELKTFEEDLHQHVHLENNLLFPKAAILIDEICN